MNCVGKYTDYKYPCKFKFKKASSKMFARVLNTPLQLTMHKKPEEYAILCD